MVLMGLTELGYLVAPELLTGVFSRHLEVVAAGVAALRWVVVYQVSTPRRLCWAGC